MRSASTVVGRKSIVESHWALRSDYLGYAIHNTLVWHLSRDGVRSLGHESTLDQIKRHGKEGRSETSTQRRQDARRQLGSVCHRITKNPGVHFLELIVTGHHTCVVEWLF